MTRQELLLSYPAVIDRNADGISITFPDFPTVASSAELEDELADTLVDALEEALEYTMSENLPIPTPSQVLGAASVTPSADMLDKVDEYINESPQSIMYKAMEAMDNQDEPLENYPDRLIERLKLRGHIIVRESALNDLREKVNA